MTVVAFSPVLPSVVLDIEVMETPPCKHCMMRRRQEVERAKMVYKQMRKAQLKSRRLTFPSSHIRLTFASAKSSPVTMLNT